MCTSHATLSGIGAAAVITTLGAVGASALIGGRRTGFGNASRAAIFGTSVIGIS